MVDRFPHMNDTDFPGLPGETAFLNNDFDYSKYDKTQMRIGICSVPWDVGLIHVGNAQIGGLGNVVYFETPEARDEYLNSIEDKYVWETEYREYHDDMYIQVPLPYEKAVRYNYIWVEYTRLPVDYSEGGKERFFFFIRECSQLASSTCKVKLMRDTWQTFIHDVNISYFMLEQGHAPMTLTSADEYLANPIENNSWLLSEDVNFGDSYKRKYHSSIVLNGSDMWCVFVTTSNPLAEFGEAHTDYWDTPNGHSVKDGQPTYYAFAIDPDDLPTFLNNMDSEVPQFAQTVQGVFFIARNLVSADVTFRFASVNCTTLIQRQRDIDLAELTKDAFGFGDDYRELAKLYTYPYSFLEIADDSGNVSQIKIEETSGNLSLKVTTSLAYPWIAIDGRLSGVGEGSAALEFFNIDRHTFNIDGDWYDHIYSWNIPTFGITQSAAVAADYQTYFDRKQKALELQTALDNTTDNAETELQNSLNSANTNYENALASASTTKTNADAIAAKDKTNSDAVVNKNYDNAINTATKNKTNSDARENTSYDNSVISANTTKANADDSNTSRTQNAYDQAETTQQDAYDNANATYDNDMRRITAARDNSLALAGATKTISDRSTNNDHGNRSRDILMQRQNTTSEINFKNRLTYLANQNMQDETDANMVKLGWDVYNDNQQIWYRTQYENENAAATTAVNTAGGLVSGGASGAINGALTGGAIGGAGGAAIGAIGGAVAPIVGGVTSGITTVMQLGLDEALANMSIEHNQNKMIHTGDLARSLTDLRKQLNSDTNVEHVNLVEGVANRVRDTSIIINDNDQTTGLDNATTAKNTSDANTNRVYTAESTNAENTKSTAIGIADRDYNTAVGNAERSYNADSTNIDRTHTTAIDNATATKNTELAANLADFNAASQNAARDKSVGLANNERDYNVSIGNNVREYDTSVANAERTLETASDNAQLNHDVAIENAQRTYDTGIAGIQSTLDQAALEAPRQYGTFADGETSVTRPQSLFCNIVTQSKDAIEQTGDHWLRFGYRCNRAWKFETFNLMKHFTYWKAADLWISGNNVPDAYLDEIRFYLMGGVCVWKNPDDIGRISVYDNL